MNVPLSFWDMSLWLAIMAIILLATSELISPHYGKTKLLISRKRLQNAAIAVSAIFLMTAAVAIINIVINP